MTSYNYYWPVGGNYPLGHEAQPQTVVGHGGQTAVWNPQSTVSSPASSLTATSMRQATPTPSKSVHGIFLKVFNPANKKEWQDYTLRTVSRETLDTPAKLREAIVSQCGEKIVPDEVGYFDQTTKHWIHNRLDMNDVWDMIESGTKVTLWCNDCACTTVKKSSHPGKHARLDAENDSNGKKPKLSSADAKKALAEEHEQELKDKHDDKYTRFQYKLWAEMIASGVYTDSDEPPAASMFSRTPKRQRGTQLKSSTTSDAVVSGMMSVMNTLPCCY